MKVIDIYNAFEKGIKFEIIVNEINMGICDTSTQEGINKLRKYFDAHIGYMTIINKKTLRLELYGI